jgi:hypothetical protein
MNGNLRLIAWSTLRENLEVPPIEMPESQVA